MSWWTAFIADATDELAIYQLEYGHKPTHEPMLLPVKNINPMPVLYPGIIPRIMSGLLTGLLMTASFSRSESENIQERLVLLATDFGLVADGVTDDGPAIRKLLEEARAAKQQVVIRFPENKRIFVATGTERYAFRLDGFKNLDIDGRKSTFLVHKDLRFLKATSCQNLRIGFLNIDVTPSPVAESVVMGVEENGRKLKVRLADPSQAGQLGGPTDEDGEQAFFGMLWLEGTHAPLSKHYSAQKVTPVNGEPDTMWVEGSDELPKWVREKLRPGTTALSLPVPGIAHRHGPGAMTVIDGCNNVTLLEVETWSAPWFAYQIFRNSGESVFREAHIRPQPGTKRITSSWRDGFHVKGNRGKLLFEDCILEGMNDDAFNVSTHGWRVIGVSAPGRALIRQMFPLQYMPMQVGDEVLVLSSDGTRRLAPSRILEMREIPRDGAEVPDLELELDRNLDGLSKGCLLWDMAASNPDTTIRRCRIGNSCRLQSSVTLDSCESNALLFFYSDPLEGPFPSRSVVRNCVLRQGRGNLHNAVSIQGWRNGTKPGDQPVAADSLPLRDMLFENNKIHGGVSASHVASLVFRNNRFAEGPTSLVITNCPGFLNK